MITWLIDTGPMVAYLAAAEPAHPLVVERLDAFAGRLATTSAVVTEAMHLVSVSDAGPDLLARFLEAGEIRVYDACQPPELREAAQLMAKYRTLPMDFADATLVLLSEAIGVTEIVTLDRRGFGVYRTRRKKPFVLVLDR